MSVHGDDIVVKGPRNHLQRFQAQVNKRFKKALEIVLRVVIHEASQYIEYSAPLVMDLERQYL